MIKWINENPGASRDEAGFWHSFEGRFEIWPVYSGRVYPTGYKLKDNLKNTTAEFERVRDAKQHALGVLLRENQ